MNTTEKGIMLLFFAPDYGSLSEHSCTLASQYKAWKTCWSSVDCMLSLRSLSRTLCSVTWQADWGGHRAENRAAGFFRSFGGVERLEFSHCEMSKNIIFEMLKITLQQVNTNPTLKLTHTVTAQSKIIVYNPVASHHLCIFSKSPDVLC